jgi:hypothetical protein
MEIEETINRQSYRGFDLVELRQAKATLARQPTRIRHE